jgi:hypothetical protein
VPGWGHRGRHADEPGCPEIDVEPRKKRSHHEIIFAGRAPRDHPSCHARRAQGNGAVHRETAGRRAPAARHPARQPGADLLLAGRTGPALVPRPDQPGRAGPRLRHLEGHRLPVPGRGHRRARGPEPPACAKPWTGPAGRACRTWCWTAPSSGPTGAGRRPSASAASPLTCGTAARCGPTPGTCRRCRPRTGSRCGSGTPSRARCTTSPPPASTRCPPCTPRPRPGWPTPATTVRPRLRRRVPGHPDPG